MKSYSDITLKYIKENKKRTLFTVMGIIISLALISGIGFLCLSAQDFFIANAKENGNYEFAYYNVDKEIIEATKNDVNFYNIGVSRNLDEYELDDNKSNIYLIGEDENTIKNIRKIKLSEGEYPKNAKEIIINEKAKEKLGFKLGQEITLQQVKYLNDNEESKKEKGEKHTYKIVGFEKESMAMGNSYNAVTLLDNIDNSKDYSVYFSSNDKGHKVEIVKEKAKKFHIASNNIEINQRLLMLQGEGSYVGMNIVVVGMIGMVLLIVIVATIFLIYNAINISVVERINSFGILRSIGATPKQIKRIVLKEGLLMCLIAVPFGVIFGYLGVYITVKLLQNSIKSMFGEVPFNIKFYAVIILFTLIIGVITILIASYGPARKAGKISPIDILKNNGALSEQKIKYSNGRIIRMFFGVEGWIAYKNIRKNRKRFIVTILSLSISLIMFIVFNTLNIKQKEDLEYVKNKNIGAAVIYTDKEKTTNIVNDLNNISAINNVYVFTQDGIPFLLEKDKVNEDALNESYEYVKSLNLIKDNKYDTLFISIASYNDKALKKAGIPNGVLKDDEVVLINKKVGIDKNGKMNSLNITDYKVGDVIRVPKSIFSVKNRELEKNTDEYLKSEEFKEKLAKDLKEANVYEFKVKNIIDDDIFSRYYNENLGIIFNENFYNNAIDTAENSGHSREIRIDFNTENEQELKKISSQIEKVAEDNDVTYSNRYEENKREEQMWLVINVFIYGFIVLITLIGIINVLTTIMLNILLKKKEFGTLETIGMSNKQLTKMIMLEGLLHGIIASILGGIVSIALVKVMINKIAQGFTITDRIPVMPFMIGFIGVLIITLIASLIPLRKLKNLSAVDCIRNNE